MGLFVDPALNIVAFDVPDRDVAPPWFDVEIPVDAVLSLVGVLAVVEYGLPLFVDGGDGGALFFGVYPGSSVALDEVFGGPVVGLSGGFEPGFGASGAGGVYVLDAPADAFGGLVLLRGGHDCS